MFIFTKNKIEQMPKVLPKDTTNKRKIPSRTVGVRMQGDLLTSGCFNRIKSLLRLLKVFLLLELINFYKKLSKPN